MTAARKLVAFLTAEVAGYSRLVGLDEAGTIARLQALRRKLIDPTMSNHHGRMVKTLSNSALVVPRLVGSGGAHGVSKLPFRDA
jgi:class 3 adenylate cyclase